MLSDIIPARNGPAHKRARLHIADDDPSAFNRWAIVFDPIVRSLLTNLPGKSDTFCRGLCEELYRCLVVKSRARDPMALSVPPLVDLAWHEAILNTQRYMMLCDALGGYIHHTTDTVEDPQFLKNQRLDKMREAYSLVWGVEPQSVYWDEGVSDTRSDDEVELVSVRLRETPRSGTEGDVLTIAFRDAEGNVSWMQMKDTTEMTKVMRAFNRRRGAEDGRFRFIFNGHVLRGNCTPRQLGMKSGDTVNCMVSILGC